MDILEYGTKLADASGLTGEARESFLKHLSSDVVRKDFEDQYASRSDLSQASEDLSVANKQVSEWQSKIQEYNDWYGSANATASQLQGENRHLQGENAAYKNIFGDLPADGAAPTNPTPTNGEPPITRQEIMEMFQAQSNSTAGLLQDFGHIITDYPGKFPGKTFPIDDFVKYASDKKAPDGALLNIRNVYDSYIHGDMEKVRENDISERIERARTEAVEDFKSKNHLPVSSTPREPSPIRASLDRESGSVDADAERSRARDAFMESWDGSIPG
jgi:hypothetical protein